MAHTINPQVRMANEIAVQFHHQPADQAATAIATHIRKFWDPRMKADLFSQADSNTASLDPLVIQAVKQLKG
ncbi:formate dehydrogenase subunit delta [Kibdelosporangium philippinense]|uniref:Formate dehydrogenase subunit delta n=1 Tax=Kibdelosporangium philippinense TaxID=211113 RepID=A0ABS8ZEU1_9PSEU|nr:formate dehydrogenase subunit delta [Kibdelosporangium philippinense]MCE7006290.1 formate dehydrogenase subunit delta [Kibdelosporangium philippinense]